MQASKHAAVAAQQQGDDADDDSVETFEQAATLVAAGGAFQLTNDQKLQLYGLFKQGTQGPPAASAKPSSLDFVGAAKYQAWQAVASLSKEQAREAYIALVQRFAAAEGAGMTGPAAGGGASGDAGGMGSGGYSSRPMQLAPTASEQARLKEDVHAVARDGTGAALSVLLGRVPASEGVAARNEVGETPLHAAADGGNLEAVAVLIQGGANVNALEDEAEQTPLHYACSLGHTEVVLALLAGGADVAAPDADGNTPWDLADEGLRRDMVGKAGVKAPQ